MSQLLVEARKVENDEGLTKIEIFRISDEGERLIVYRAFSNEQVKVLVSPGPGMAIIVPAGEA